MIIFRHNNTTYFNNKHNIRVVRHEITNFLGNFKWLIFNKLGNSVEISLKNFYSRFVSRKFKNALFRHRARWILKTWTKNSHAKFFRANSRMRAMVTESLLEFAGFRESIILIIEDSTSVSSRMQYSLFSIHNRIIIDSLFFLMLLHMSNSILLGFYIKTFIWSFSPFFF